MSVIGSAILKEGSEVGPIMRADGHREFLASYLVRTSNPNESGDVIAKAAGLPRLATAEPSYSPALLMKLEPRQSAETNLVWEVLCQWSTDLGGGDPQDLLDIPPTQRPLKYDWSSRQVEIHPLVDLKGKPFLNSAGDPFDPAPTIYATHLVLNVQANYSGFNPRVARNYEGAINSRRFLYVFAKWTCKLSQIRAVPRFEMAEAYFETSYQIEITEDLDHRRWHPDYRLNKGPRYLKLAPNMQDYIKVLARDDQGVADGREVLLGAGGMKLLQSGQPTYEEFQSYPIRNFGILNLG